MMNKSLQTLYRVRKR